MEASLEIRNLLQYTGFGRSRGLLEDIYIYRMHISRGDCLRMNCNTVDDGSFPPEASNFTK